MKQLLFLQEDILLSNAVFWALPLDHVCSSCAVQIDQGDSRSFALGFVALTQYPGGITSSRFIKLSCSTAGLSKNMCFDKLTDKLAVYVMQEKE